MQSDLRSLQGFQSIVYPNLILDKEIVVQSDFMCFSFSIVVWSVRSFKAYLG